MYGSLPMPYNIRFVFTAHSLVSVDLSPTCHRKMILIRFVFPRTIAWPNHCSRFPHLARISGTLLSAFNIVPNLIFSGSIQFSLPTSVVPAYWLPSIPTHKRATQTSPLSDKTCSFIGISLSQAIPLPCIGQSLMLSDRGLEFHEPQLNWLRNGMEIVIEKIHS